MIAESVDKVKMNGEEPFGRNLFSTSKPEIKVAAETIRNNTRRPQKRKSVGNRKDSSTSLDRPAHDGRSQFAGCSLALQRST